MITRGCGKVGDRIQVTIVAKFYVVGILHSWSEEGIILTREEMVDRWVFVPSKTIVMVENLQERIYDKGC